MAVILLIALATIVIRVWWELHKVAVMRRELTPAGRAALDNRVAERRARIIADGLARHNAFKQAHPIRGALRRYDGDSYYIFNQSNLERYPRLLY